MTLTLNLVDILIVHSYDFDVLIWVVSSHGGHAGAGPFFIDSAREKIYLYGDLVSKFYAENCEAMRGKAAFYIPSFCQSFTGEKYEGKVEDIYAGSLKPYSTQDDVVCE